MSDKLPFVTEAEAISSSAWEALGRERDPLGNWNRCRDFDEDCAGVRCKVACWLYDPERGWCPYLRPPVR